MFFGEHKTFSKNHYKEEQLLSGLKVGKQTKNFKSGYRKHEGKKS